MLLSAIATVVELKSDSKKHKRGVAFFGSPDFFGFVPAFSPSWAPNFATSAWNPPIAPDVALAQVEVQATHDVALQVRTFFYALYITPRVLYTQTSIEVCGLYILYRSHIEVCGLHHT